MISLTVTDNGDGTGGVATVSGMSGAAAVTIYAASFDGTMQAMIWNLVASNTGGGTINLASPSIPLGYYLWLAQSIDGGVTSISNVVYQNFSTPLTAFHKAILDAVVVRINSIGFSWLPTAKVIERWMPRFQDQVDGATPLCYVSPIGAEVYRDGTIEQDDPGYPVFVVLVDKSQKSNIVDNNVLLWRQQVSKAIRNQRLPGVNAVYISDIEPETIIDAGAWSKNTVLSIIMFRFYTRETRGLGS